MIFGTQIGVAPGFTGTMPQGPGWCPPDPIWRYFPSPFEPLTYFGPGPSVPIPQRCLPKPPLINVEPPNLPPEFHVPRVPSYTTAPTRSPQAPVAIALEPSCTTAPAARGTRAAGSGARR